MNESSDTSNRLRLEADEALGQCLWLVVRDRDQQVLTLDPDADARGFLATTDRALDMRGAGTQTLCDRVGEEKSRE